jgi:DNA-binding transcriptional MerR regulator
MITSFNSKAISKIIGIPPRVIDYWDRSNFIKPSINEASGQGSTRLYSFSDLAQFKVAHFLRGQGLSLQKIRKSLNFLRKHLPEIERPLAELRFLTDGETLFVLTNKDKEIMDTLKRGQYVLAIAIEKLIRELEGKVSKMPLERMYWIHVSRRKLKVMVRPNLQHRGYRAECPDFPGLSSQGDSVEETLDGITDAVKLNRDAMLEPERQNMKRKVG